MDRTSLTERNDFIVQDYKSGMDVGELQRTYGLTRRRILQILREAQVELRPRPRAGELQPLSRRHDRIGRTLYDAMIDRGQDEHDAANELGWSLHKFKRIIKGRDDLALLDLLDVVHYTGKKIDEVVGNV